MLTAEKVRTRIVKGYSVREWVLVNSHARNEALDIWVYNLAAIKILRPNFTAIERKIASMRQSDPDEPEKKEKPKAIKRKRTKRKRKHRGGNAWGG